MKMIKSVICFLVNKTFNHLVIFIYNSIKILILILVLRSPSDVLRLFCGFSDHPHRGYLTAGILLALFIRKLQRKLR